MAFVETKHVQIDGIAACVPNRVVSNRDYPYLSKSEIDKYIAMTGIEQRHCAIPDGSICCSDLCYTAADKLLCDLSWDRSEVDLLIFVSQTQDYKLPATSCILQNRLGLPTSCMAFDISYGCSGFVYGLSVATSLLSKNINKALLLVGNTQSVYASPFDKSLALLFGDAGTAMALSFKQDSDEEIVFNLCSDGSGKDALLVRDGGCRNPINSQSLEFYEMDDGIRRTNLHEKMDGAEVFSFGLNRAPSVYMNMCKHFAINKQNIDYLCLHQANKFLCEKIRKKLDFQIENVPYNLQEYGNTSGASIPLLMVTEMHNQLRTQPLTIAAIGFGVGLSWGSTVFSTNKIVVPDLFDIINLKPNMIVENPFGLINKTILVTGASSGIGRSVALLCSQMGASVILNGRDNERLNEVYNQLFVSSPQQSHQIIQADLTEDSTLITVVEQAPCLDGIVHCAGVNTKSLLQFVDRDKLNAVFNLNCFVPALLTKSLLKGKKINKSASIVIISSIASFYATISNCMYGASKGALNSLIRIMALELASKKIRVNGIMPGIIGLDMMKAYDLSNEELENVKKTYPLGRFGTPKDVANGVVYLLSDASSWVTGSNIVIDGGVTLR